MSHILHYAQKFQKFTCKPDVRHEGNHSSDSCGPTPAYGSSIYEWFIAAHT